MALGVRREGHSVIIYWKESYPKAPETLLEMLFLLLILSGDIEWDTLPFRDCFSPSECIQWAR